MKDPKNNLTQAPVQQININRNPAPATDKSQAQSSATLSSNTNQTSTPPLSQIPSPKPAFNPPGDAVSVITSPHTPQKYGGRKIIATIFGILFVVGGTISGALLVQRQQNMSEKAWATKQYDATCSEIRAYDLNWNALDSTSLVNLTPGTIVRFTISGTTTSGNFDKARFTINGSQTPEVTQTRPNTHDFFYEYIIPEVTTDFTIQGQIHHTIWGWI